MDPSFVAPPAGLGEGDETCALPLCSSAPAWSGRGRPPAYCSDRCRKQHHRDRGRAAALRDAAVEEEARQAEAARELVRCASTIAASCAADPAGAAVLLADWANRRDWSGRDHVEVLFRLERFITRPRSR